MPGNDFKVLPKEDGMLQVVTLGLLPVLMNEVAGFFVVIVLLAGAML